MTGRVEMCPEHPKETTATCFLFSFLLKDFSKIKMNQINNKKSFFYVSQISLNLASELKNKHFELF